MTDTQKPAGRKRVPEHQKDSDKKHQRQAPKRPRAKEKQRAERAAENDLETCKDASGWSLYILRCSDDSLYTGITTDVLRRVNEHNGLPNASAAKRGAAYTRARRPVTLVYQEQHPDRKAASKREWIVKRLSRAAKQTLVFQHRQRNK